MHFSIRKARDDENDAHAHEDEEHPSRSDKLHERTARESTESKNALCTSEEPGAVRVTRASAACDSSLGDIVDETSCDGDLGACVAELREGGVEEFVLFAEGFDI